MKNTTCIVIALVLVGVFCGTLVLAQTGTPKTVDWKVRAEAASAEKLANLIRYYKPTEDQKIKLKEALIAQYKDLMDQDKIAAEKIKALDAEIAEVNVKIAALDKEIAVIVKKKAPLLNEIASIEKRKSVYAKARSELLLDHKAEIDDVFTQEQKIARLSEYIRQRAISYQCWLVLPKATRDSVIEQCDEAALELLEAGKSEDSTAIREAYRKIADANKAVVTPEIRRAGEVKYYMDSTMRKFTTLKLTEAQKTAVRDLCEKAAKRKASLYAQYQEVSEKYKQISKDRSALRSAVSRMYSSSTSVYHKIRADVINTILTDAQLKQIGYRRKSSKPRKKL